tara:strand:+ start:599 stop:985 length:387 start_codon:yes stop_codon:yes gene_type:complete
MQWQIHQNEKGVLVPIELDTLPFTPQRIFYVKDVPKGSVRGNHAHYQTQQILTCLQGVIHVELDYGDKTWHVELKANESVFCDKMVWDTQTYKTDDSILMSICSTKHDPQDYITDYEKFLDERKKVCK